MRMRHGSQERVTNQNGSHEGARRTGGGSRGWSGETIYSELIATGLRVPWKRQWSGIACERSRRTDGVAGVER